MWHLSSAGVSAPSEGEGAPVRPGADDGPVPNASWEEAQKPGAMLRGSLCTADMYWAHVTLRCSSTGPSRVENSTESGSSRAVCSAASPVCSPREQDCLSPSPTQALASAPEPAVPGARVAEPPRDPRVQPPPAQRETSAAVTGQRPPREPLRLPSLYFPSRAEPSHWPPSNLRGTPAPIFPPMCPK